MDRGQMRDGDPRYMRTSDAVCIYSYADLDCRVDGGNDEEY